MPHVIVKLQSGRSEQQKAKLAEEITKAVMVGANCAEESVSVSIVPVEMHPRFLCYRTPYSRVSSSDSDQYPVSDVDERRG
jgi:phenylpyruvate tautomerase PptA (4-oxalocrotonate tautomerase family)